MRSRSVPFTGGVMWLTLPTKTSFGLFGRGVGAGQWRISSGRPDRFAQPLHREFDILRLDLAPALDLPREPIGNLAPLCARL